MTEKVLLNFISSLLLLLLDPKRIVKTNFLIDGFGIEVFLFGFDHFIEFGIVIPSVPKLSGLLLQHGLEIQIVVEDVIDSLQYHIKVVPHLLLSLLFIIFNEILNLLS